MLLFLQFGSDVTGSRTCLLFLDPPKVCQISIQSDNSIETYRVHRDRTDRYFRKNRFF